MDTNETNSKMEAKKPYKKASSELGEVKLREAHESDQERDDWKEGVRTAERREIGER